MIDEKLTTGYHGVKHLFSSNDLSKSGRLTKYFFSQISLKFKHFNSDFLFSKRRI
jgi:hypothetical protein